MGVLDKRASLPDVCLSCPSVRIESHVKIPAALHYRQVGTYTLPPGRRSSWPPLLTVSSGSTQAPGHVDSYSRRAASTRLPRILSC